MPRPKDSDDRQRWLHHAYTEGRAHSLKKEVTVAHMNLLGAARQSEDVKVVKAYCEWEAKTRMFEEFGGAGARPNSDTQE